MFIMNLFRKKECHICLEKKMKFNICEVCKYEVCYACNIKINYKCPHCRNVDMYCDDMNLLFSVFLSTLYLLFLFLYYILNYRK
jgi:hypothetical protein